MTSGAKPSKSSRSSRKSKRRRGSKTTARRIRVPLAKAKDELSRYLRLASEAEILITRHGRPAGILIGFADEQAWLDYQIENNPEFLERIARAREALHAGRGTKLEDLAD